jgi:hypothetical protein
VVSGTPTTAGGSTVSGITGATGDNNQGNNTTSGSVTAAPAVVAATTPIPTLSEYMLVALAGLMLIFGFAPLRKRLK